MKRINTLSLFTGGGGLDIGFHKAGFDIVACLEIDAPSCKTLELNRGEYLGANTKVFNTDITKTAPEDLNIGSIDFMIGGPPCQSFSAAGRRAGGVTGINDTRGSLFWYYCQYLEYFKPEGFLFENVKGLLQANKANDWNVIQRSFSDLGYKLSYRVMDAADFGVPQHRERVVLVGSKNGSFLFPRPTHGVNSKDGTPYLTLGEAFEDIDDPDEIVPPYGGKYGDLIPDIPPGMNYSFYTQRMGHPYPRFAWRSKFSSFLYKADPQDLSKTIVAHQSRYDGPFHWKNRKLNLRELMRVQSFPDDYKYVESFSEASKQIGNSVAPKLARVLADAIAHQYFERSGDINDYLQPEEIINGEKRKSLKSKETLSKTIRNNPQNHSKQQLSFLYEDKIDWPQEKFRDEITVLSNHLAEDNRFSREFDLANGCWDIKLVNQSAKFMELILCLELQFFSPVANKFNAIVAELHSDTLWDVNVLWDSIHYIVSQSSSYDNLHPLYGHFTEPYPQFEIVIRSINSGENAMHSWINNITNYKYLSVLHKLSDLAMFDAGNLDVLHTIKKLRNVGFDVRVHQTNRSIPEGWYRVCYPYTAYSEEKSYVVWTEVGNHKTADLRIVETTDGIAPRQRTLDN